MAIASPDHFLELRIQDITLEPVLNGLCAGYEEETWRYRQLAKHLTDWLPEFALKWSEWHSINHANCASRLARAANVVYSVDEPDDDPDADEKEPKRGEIGELLLHIAIRQVYSTIPAISKYFYKSTTDDTIKGFDAVHVVVNGEELELWPGEAKFYIKPRAAIRAAIASLEEHMNREYMRSEFAVITNMIDDNWPHSERLKKLLHPNSSIDQVFDRICVPVLIAYDSTIVGKHKKICEEYTREFEQETKELHKYFREELLSLGSIKYVVQLFLIPMSTKKLLVNSFDKELRKWQTI